MFNRLLHWKKKYIYIHIFDNHKHKLVCCLFNNLIIKEKREFDKPKAQKRFQAQKSLQSKDSKSLYNMYIDSHKGEK